MKRVKISSPSSHNDAKRAARAPKTKKDSRLWRYMYNVFLTMLVFLVISFFMAPHQWNIASLFDKPSGSQDVGASSAPSNFGKQGIPSAIEYRAYARQNGWSPVEPVEKLEMTIRRLPQVFDMDKQTVGKNADELIKLLHDEISFVLQVLAKSKSERFDLTNLAFIAMDVMNQCMYRVMKKRIEIKSPMTISKELTEQMTRTWLSTPLRKLLQLRHQNHTHIQIDLHRKVAGGGTYDALSRAVQLRFYGLYSVFASWTQPQPSEDITRWQQWTQSIESAFRVAVHNGDDLTVALLVQLLQQLSSQRPSTLGSTFATSLANLAEEAQMLGFYPLSNRIMQFVARLAIQAQEPLDPTVHAAVDKYMSIVGATHWNDTLELQGTSFPMQHESSSSSSMHNHERRCIVDVRSVSDFLSRDAEGHWHANDLFLREYVEKQRPVLMTVNTEEDKLRVQQLQREIEQQIFSDIIPSIDGSSSSSSSRLPLSPLPYGHSLFGTQKAELVPAAFKAYLKEQEKLTSEKWEARLQRLYASSEQAEAADNDGDTLSRVVGDYLRDNAGDRETLPWYLFVATALHSQAQAQASAAAAEREAGEHLAQRIAPHVQSYLADSGLQQLISAVAAPSSSSSVSAPSRLQVYLGPAFSGAPWHNHGPALNLCLTGRKHWRLLPVAMDAYSALHPLLELQPGNERMLNDSAVHDPSAIERVRKLSCSLVQPAQTVLFVPRHVSHTVLNLQQSLGFAYEVTDYVH